MSTVDDYVVVDLPSPATKDDTSNSMPSSEFFPVSQVLFNPNDMSICVVNIGLCVLLYSFQPTNTSPIKVCVVCVFVCCICSIKCRIQKVVLVNEVTKHMLDT